MMLIKRFSFVGFFIITFSIGAISQTITNLDSLENVLKIERTDTITFRNYLNRLVKLENDDIAAKEIIGNWIIKNCTSKGTELIKAETYQLIGESYFTASEYTKALEYCNKAIEIAEEKKFIEIHFKALYTTNNVYYQTEQFEESGKVLKECLAFAEKNNYWAGIAKSKFSLATSLDDFGYPKTKDTFNLVFKNINEGLEIWKKLKDTSLIVNSFIRMGEVYSGYKIFDSAIINMKKAELLINIGNSKIIYVDFNFTMGKILYEKAVANNNNKNELNEAIKYLSQCIPLAKAFNKPKYIAWCLDWIGNCYDKLGDYKKAFEFKEKYTYAFARVVNENNFKKLNSIKNKFEAAKKDNEILKLDAVNKQKSTLNKILIGSAIGLLLISLLGYRNFKNKQKIASQHLLLQQQQIIQLEKDKQLLAVDAMLKGQEEERSRLAKDLHDGLGGMLSGVKLSFVNMKENMIMDAPGVLSFEASILQLDNTIAELRKVAHNLMPEALVKFGLKNAVLDFCNSMQLSSKIKIIFEQMGNERPLSNTADLYIYRIIQELINNALKHAKPNQILVQLTKADKNVLLTVENDGQGFDAAQLKNADGIGLKSVQQRVDYFTGKMDMSSTETGGTSINIELNV